MLFKKSTLEFAGAMESFLLSGLAGEVLTSGQEIVALKTKVAQLIFDKLGMLVSVPRCELTNSHS